MKVKIAIVDDMADDRTQLKSCVDEFFKSEAPDFYCVDLFNSAEEMLSAFAPDKYDLVFLDICMDEMNGIDLARSLRAADPHLMIVFQTTERSYAFDAFPVHPFDYLIKPCRQDDVDGVLSEAMRVLEAGDPEIVITSGRTAYNVPLRSLVAVISQGHNTELYLSGKQHLNSSDTFKSISGRLESDERFLLINRGIMINMDYVLSPANGNMQMKDGSVYPIRVNGRASVLAAFSQYMISRVDRRLQP